MDFNQIKNIYNACDKVLVGGAIPSFHQNLISARKKHSKRVNG